MHLLSTMDVPVDEVENIISCQKSLSFNSVINKGDKNYKKLQRSKVLLLKTTPYPVVVSNIIIFTPVWERFPFCPRFFKWVETTNQVDMYRKKTQATLRLTPFFRDWHSIWEIHLWSPLFDKEHNILPFFVSFQQQQTFTFLIPQKLKSLSTSPPQKKKQHNTTQQGRKKHNSTRKTTSQQNLLQIYQVGMNLSIHSPPSIHPLLRRRSITPGRAPWCVRAIGWWSPSCNRSSVPNGWNADGLVNAGFPTKRKNTHTVIFC